VGERQGGKTEFKKIKTKNIATKSWQQQKP